jgi:hypothetical protein
MLGGRWCSLGASCGGVGCLGGGDDGKDDQGRASAVRIVSGADVAGAGALRLTDDGGAADRWEEGEYHEKPLPIC